MVSFSSLSDIIQYYSARSIPMEEIAVVYEGETPASVYYDYSLMIDVYDGHIADVYSVGEGHARQIDTALFDVPSTWGAVYASIIRDVADSWSVISMTLDGVESDLRASIIRVYEKSFYWNGKSAEDFYISKKTAFGCVGGMSFYLTDSRHVVFYGNHDFPEQIFELKEVY